MLLREETPLVVSHERTIHESTRRIAGNYWYFAVVTDQVTTGLIGIGAVTLLQLVTRRSMLHLSPARDLCIMLVYERADRNRNSKL